MTRPVDIPEDVWAAARRAVLPQYDSDMDSYGRVFRGEADTWPVVKVAARAILAERDRCRAVANERAAQLWAAIQLPTTDETKAGWAGQMIEALTIEQRISDGHLAKDTINIEGLHAAAAEAGFVA